MNKKFLSAILFGALMVTSTGTFVSCKDYDDDIDNLQTQIDKLATKEDMTSQIASLQSALSSAAAEAAAAKTTAADALAKATASEKAAAQAALDAAAAKEEAIKAAQDEVAKAKAELEEAIAADFEAVKEDLAKQIAELTEKVEEMTGYTTEMLTGLQLKSNWTLDLNYARIDIKYPKGLVKGGDIQEPSTYVFGEGMPGAFTLTDNEVNTVKDNMIIAVNPVNAVVTSDMLSLVNGKGGTVDNYVDFTVANYKGNTLVSRAAETGLRQIGVQLKKDVDFEAFDKLVLYGTNHNVLPNVDCSDTHTYIAYALAVTDAQDRTVMSDYKISMHVKAEQPAVNIAENSYLASSAQKIFSEPISSYQWGWDDTNYEDAFPITLGEAFELSVGSDGGRVMASYVVVDYDNEALSTTDKAAIKGLTINGVNQVSKDLYHAISVSGTYATGVPVPLKLVTVDYRGNIDVNVFWVKAGEPVAMSVTYTVTPSKNVSNPSAWAPTAKTGESTMEEFKVPANAEFYSIEWYVGETNHQNDKLVAWNYQGLMENINNGTNYGTALKFYDANKNLTADPEYIAYSEFVGTLNLQLMRENKAYAGIIKFYDKNNTHVSTNEIAVKKVLPTVIPAGLSAKENAINNGVLTVYPVPASDAKFELANAFNFKNGLDTDANLVFETLSFWNANDEAWMAAYKSDRSIDINYVSIIDGTTTFPTTVKYNYGDIKYQPEGHGVADAGNHWVEWGTKFDIKFSCYPVDCTYSWYNTPVVYYKEAVTLDGHARKADGTITEKRNVIKVLDPYAKEVNAFSTVSTNPWLTWAQTLNSYTIELWTNGDDTKVNEFFTPSWAFDTANDGKVVIKLEPTSTNVVLSGDVEITVVVKIKDNFFSSAYPAHAAHAVKALTFTMKKDHVVAE